MTMKMHFAGIRTAWILLIFSLSSVTAKPLQLWVNSDTDRKYYENMVKLYQKDFDPKFKMDIRSYGFVEMPDKLSIAIKTGINAPDIVQIDELYFSLFLKPDDMPFLDLTERIKKSGLERGMMPQRMRLFEHKNRYYGLPQSISAVVLYYRADVFEELQISPRSIDTWDKFMEVGRRLKTGNRSLLAMDWSYFEILLRQRGYDLFDTDGKDRLLDSVTVETLDFLVKMSQEGVGENPDRGSIFDATFFGGDVANNEVMAIMGAGWYGLDMIQNLSPPELIGKWRAMPLPTWTDDKSNKRTTSTFSGQGLVLFSKTKRADDAWKFVQWVMENPEANVQRYLQGNCITPFRPAWVDMRFNRPDSTFGGQSLGAITLELASQVPAMVQDPRRIIVVNLLRENYWQSLMDGTTSAKEVLTAIRAELGKGKSRK